MTDKVKIQPLHEIPKKIREDASFRVKDPYHADYFWRNCAEKWHNEFVHKVFGAFSNNKMLGYFSIRANEIILKKNNEKQNIPIADGAFMDIRGDLEEETSKELMKALLEFIEHKFADH